VNEAGVTLSGPQAPSRLILVSARKTAVVYLPPVLYAVQGRDTSVREASSKEHIVQGLSFGDTSVTFYAPFTKICVETRRGGLMLLFIA
jgi:hypothetical protein